MDPYTYLNSISPEIIDEMYQAYLKNPESVDPDWKRFFEGYAFGQINYEQKESHKEGAHPWPDEFKVINLINGYRERGHLFTRTNPVRKRRQYSPTLAIENFELSVTQLEQEFEAGNEIGIGKAKLSAIINHLEDTYCGSFGAEYRFIRNTAIINWLQHKMESRKNLPDFSSDEKMHILKKLSEAVFFEKFIHRKFPGQKRFSLEGAESLIPALDAVIEKGAQHGIEEFVIGMAHRGRLNVLANILHKSPEHIFNEFGGKEYEEQLLGDVKYHLGYTSRTVTSDGHSVKLTLSPNPSHLEAVNPVVEGISRAKAQHHYKRDFRKITPILIHGDASVSGQGIIYEILQMSELDGYRTGGTIHLVINNQIGFTTNYLEGRSSTYCTDVAKTIQAPVFHVNGDDAEAVVYSILLAMEYREKFQKDIFIDLLCYRKYGHNEGDEPRFTQPILYKKIAKHPDPREIYAQKLKNENLLNTKEEKNIEKRIINGLEKEFSDAQKKDKASIMNFLEERWQGIRQACPGDFDESPDTSVPKEIILDLGKKITATPPGKKLFRKLEKLQEVRANMITEGESLDWATCELLSWASLLNENTQVRVSGQDSQRGTFSQRHSVLRVEDSEEVFIPLKHISKNTKDFSIYNSPLSEYGVLGFEYGYSLASPNSLIIWEAQFGDFFNGAQIIIDQFLTCAEEKWNVMNHLVMMLPHGYEGQGPEHSSGRIERFLNLCAENNMQVVNCTTPANHFHVLRRQIHRPFRKPLIAFTPKSLLRHPECTSSLEELTENRFMEVIDDNMADPSEIDRVILCSGKVYYDLIKEKREKKYYNTAIIRLEQLYPLPVKQLESLVEKYNTASEWLWVQEEPANMGAWTFISRSFRLVPLTLIARPDSASSATGSSELHAIRQRKVVEKAFGECGCERVKQECKMLCAPKEWQINVKMDN